MKIFLGSDHGGFKLKANLRPYLVKLGYEVVDLGNILFDPQDDHPDFAQKVAMEVSAGHGIGILMCRNGIGVCITANKIKGVRAVSATHEDVVRTSREDDDTNVFCIAADFIPFEEVKKLVSVWLNTPFSKDERHVRRLNKIAQLGADL